MGHDHFSMNNVGAFSQNRFNRLKKLNRAIAIQLRK